MDDKVKKLEQAFLGFQQNLLTEAVRNRDLDEAAGDFSSANKETVKINMFSRVIETFEQVKRKGTLKAVEDGFTSWLNEEKTRLEQLISEAREQDDKQLVIDNQIRKSVLDGPVGTIFKHYLAQVQS